MYIVFGYGYANVQSTQLVAFTHLELKYQSNMILQSHQHFSTVAPFFS